jgi:hypothetical protein
MSRNVKELSAKSYISTEAFDDNFFKYVVTTGPPPQFKKTGALVAVDGATPVNCPAGHVLRENGKKLYPDAYPGVKTYMVGVFDIISTLSGFINPNDPVFAPFNGDRPNYLKDSVNEQSKNLGPPVFTQGSVMSNDVTVLGSLFLNSGNSGIATFTALTPVVGPFKKLTVPASNCRDGSIVMLTYASQNNVGVLSAETITNGSFQIVSSSITDLGSVMYMVIN